jgi:PAS domain S-box-containing protein
MAGKIGARRARCLFAAGAPPYLRSATSERPRMNPGPDAAAPALPPAGPRAAEADALLHARILESVGEAVVATTPDGTIRFWGSGAERLYGWPAGEAVGRSILDVTPSAASREQAAEIMRALSRGERWEGELEVRRRDGTCFVARVVDTPMLDAEGRLVGVVGVSVDVTAEMRAQRERSEALAREREARADAERVNARLQAAGRITHDVMRATTLDEVLAIVVDGMREALDADAVTLLLPDDGGAMLRVRAGSGRPAGDVAPVPLGRGVTGAIAATLQPLIVMDLRAVEVVDPFLRDRMRSLIGVPLVMEDRLVGVLHVASATPRRFTGDELTLLELVGARASSAIVRAQLYDAERAARRAAEQAWRAAEAAREDAERASRAKSDFLAVMSHELRTPLSAIAGYAELLRMEIHGPVTVAQRDALTRLRAAGDHLLGLIDDMLEHARLQSGRTAYRAARVPVAAAVADAEVSVRPQLEAKGLAWRCDVAEEGLAVRADRERLVQILINLIGNATKFTDAGEVRVSAAAEGEVVRIAVRDTGRGIPADRLREVFDPFVQVHGESALTRATPGVGLGLSISRDLARGMGGELSVASEPGRGSTFVLALPRA